ncbi:MAG: recombination mediator RecR [Candidatus Komeilibacteria bacterium]|nr:recombination mediator RecR [Candidatus Komeilibacteria bacterium]
MLPNSLQKLIAQLSHLPGIGPKTAARLAFYLVGKPQADLDVLATAIVEAKKDLKTCSVCLNLTQADPCLICTDKMRDQQTVCVVASSQDQESIEKTGEFQGAYHILGGVLNPLEGIGPDSLNITQLIARVKSGKIKEVILGLNPDLEGESTSLYLQKLLKTPNVKITRLAKGLPSGSDIEYADEITLGSALKNRREV